MTFLHIHKIFKLLNTFVLLLFVSALSWTSWIFFSSKQKDIPTRQTASAHSSPSPKSVNYEQIGTGAFETSIQLKHFPLPDLKQDLFFFGESTRPDAKDRDAPIHIGLKESDKPLRTAPGQKLYLSYTRDSLSSWQFSSEPTPLWIAPRLSETGKILVDLGISLCSEGGKTLIEREKTFELEDSLQKKHREERDLSFQDAVTFLKRGIWREPDHLLNFYGGTEYQSIKDLNRIELTYAKHTDMLYVKQGDTFAWKEGKWTPSETHESSQEFPLAQLTSLSPHQMEWKVWSKDGLETALIAHKKEQVPKLCSQIIEGAVSRIRQRTATQISCQVGDLTMTLQTGDWLLLDASGWHVLKKLWQVENVLTFQTKGNLFVFDGISASARGPVLYGTLFDQMRTQSQKVEIALSTQKQQEQSPHKKKAVSARIQSNSSTEEDYQYFKRAQEMKMKAQANSENREEVE